MALHLEGGFPLGVFWKLFRYEQQCQRLLGLGNERLQTLPALIQLFGKCLFFHEWPLANLVSD